MDSFAEPLFVLKNSIINKCILPVRISSDAITTLDNSFLFSAPKLTATSSGSGTKLSFPGVDSVTVPKAPLFVDSGVIKRVDSYSFDFNGVSNLLFYRDGPGMFILVEPSQLSKYQSYPVCKYSESVVKFCLFDETLKIWKYDSSKKDLVNKPAKVKFAYKFKKGISDVASFTVSPALYSSETVLLVWKKITSIEVPTYKLFYASDTDVFVGKSSKKFKSDNTLSAGVTSVSINVKDLLPKNKFNSVSLDSVPSCVWDDQSLGLCSPQYELVGPNGTKSLAKLTPGTLYYDSSKDSYIYLLAGAPNNKKVNYAIIGIDQSLEESPHLKAPDALGFAIDNVPPVPPADLVAKKTSTGGLQVSWNSGDIKNIDGTLSDDVDFYEVYCTSKQKESYKELSTSATALKSVLTSPALIDKALFDASCSGKARIIVIPVDKASPANKFEWPTTSVPIQ